MFGGGRSSMAAFINKMPTKNEISSNSDKAKTLLYNCVMYPIVKSAKTQTFFFSHPRVLSGPFIL